MLALSGFTRCLVKMRPKLALEHGFAKFLEGRTSRAPILSVHAMAIQDRPLVPLKKSPSTD